MTEIAVDLDLDEKKQRMRKSTCSRPPEKRNKCLIAKIFSSIAAFVGVYSVSALMTSVLSLYIASQITAIEKQFGLNSSQSGFLLSCNDIGFVLTTLFASYYARRVHVPRALCVTGMLYGVGGLISSTPYFLGNNLAKELSYNLLHARNSSFFTTDIKKMSKLPGAPMCEIGENNNQSSSKTEEKTVGIGRPSSYTNLVLVLIGGGMIIQGMAKASRYPFVSTYVDDNGPREKTAMYLGIISGIGILGPALAFVAGGMASKFYVTLEDVPIGPRHPAWIGAWWLGFVIFGLISIFIGLPLLCFPRGKYKGESLDGVQLLSRKTNFTEIVKEFVKAMLRLVTNGVYMPLLCSSCMVLFFVAGTTAFSPKYIEVQFSQPAWKANIMFGGSFVVCASTGTLLGGVVTSKMKITPLTCTLLALLFTCFRAFMVFPNFIFGCPNQVINGFSNDNGSALATNRTCEVTCGCDTETFSPVCGSDNKNYLTPCHAGCTDQDMLTYVNCSCIWDNGTAEPGLCEPDCNMLYPYIAGIVLSVFLGTFANMPTFMALIRSVEEIDKPLAIGFSSFLTVVCGWLAGPVIFGMLIDTTCDFWTTSSSEKGACALYNNDKLRVRMTSLQLGALVFAVLLAVVAYMKARRTNWNADVQECEIFELDNTAEGEVMTLVNNKEVEL